jgi:predicted phage tail protein
MLRKIKLYGELAKFLGQKTFEAEVHNAAQAIRFLVVNFPQLEAHMADRHYKVAVNDWDIGEDELHYPNGQEDIRIIPVVGGAGRGFGRFLLGAALIGASFIPGLQGMSIGTFGGEAIALSTIVGTIGASLALQGIAQMLTPVPKVTERELDPRLSFNFSGIQNTSRAGIAVPVIYGTTLTGSIVISAAIDNEQVEV